MGSFRFRRTLKIAPGLRLNINKRSLGLSTGVPGARISANTDRRSTRSVGIPGTGLYYREQTAPQRGGGGGKDTRVAPMQKAPFSEMNDDELLLSVVMGYFGAAPTRTAQEVLEADDLLRTANRIDRHDPQALETQARFGITPEQYDELQQQMDAEERERMTAAIPAALHELVRRGLLTNLGETYTITAEGVVYLRHKQAEGAAARAAHGSTPEARTLVFRLLGSEGGSLYDVIGRSKENDGIGLERDWAQLNLDELLARGEVTKVGDRYLPARA